MPGGNVCEENLEQRIERIRKRDEEIEKRHREAEADRLAALQANAMVKMTAPAEDDWPKAHKYDKLDFTYDVKSENIDADEKKAMDEQPRQLLRPFKKFPEGQGPPADPTYNFLAEPERDGKITANNTTSECKNWRTNNNTSNSTSSNNINKRNNANNSSFNRGRNGGKAKIIDAKNPFDGKKKSNDEPILRKNERERNMEPRLQRQKSSDGMWRETKNTIPTSPTKKADNRQSNFRSDAISPKAAKPSIHQRIGKIEPDGLQQKLSNLSIEKRGNITVSVTKDGEVKSVKLEAARAIGTGRVGGGGSGSALLRQNMQPQQQFMVDPPAPVVVNPTMNASAINYPTIDQFIPPQQHQQKHHQHQQQHHQQQQQQQQHQQQQHEQQYQQPTFQPVAMPQAPQVQVPVPAQIAVQKPMSNVINGVPFKLPSVQDRLIKNRVFFDEKLKNVAQSSNAKAIAGNQ